MAQDDFTRAMADPAFLRRVTVEYSGRHDVLDALWWHTRPEGVAPSGAVSPALGLAGLKQAVFSESGANARDGRADRLAELELQLAEDHSTIAAAIDRANRSTETRGQRRGAVTEVGVGASAVRDPAAPSAGRPVRPAWRARTVLTAALLSAVALGAVFGAQFATLAAPTPGPAPNAEAGDQADPDRALFLAAFSRPQQTSDRPLSSLGADIDPDSVRRLDSGRVLMVGAIDETSVRELSTLIGVYFARDVSGRVCLILARADDAADGGRASSCASEDDSSSSGLQVSWATYEIQAFSSVSPGEVDPTVVIPVDYEVAVAPDGSMESFRMPRGDFGN